jgi:hypothetical protein
MLATNESVSSSICQRNSWRPLQITKPMLDKLVQTHAIHAAFWNLPSCFYIRNLDLEEVSCIPYTEYDHNVVKGTDNL